MYGATPSNAQTEILLPIHPSGNTLARVHDEGKNSDVRFNSKLGDCIKKLEYWPSQRGKF